MTTYPRPTDPVGAFTRADGTTVAHSTDHGRLIGFWENAKHHGAVADATLSNYTTTATDSTTPIQAAITAAAGNVCYLPTGWFRTTDTLIVPSGTTFAGAGPGSTATGNGTVILADTGTDPAIVVPGSSSHVGIRDMLITGNSGEAILLDGDSGHVIGQTAIDNVFVGSGDATHFAIDATWALETYISRCRSAGCLGGGIHLDTCNASSIRENVLSNTGAGALGAVFIESTSDATLQANVFEAWRGSYGVHINCDDTVVIGNHFEDNSGKNLWLESCHGISVIGNNIDGDFATKPSLYANSVRQLTFQGNSTSGAIKLLSSVTVNLETQVTLIGNYLSGSEEVDISGLANASDVVVRINDRRDGSAGPAVDVLVGNVALGASSKMGWRPSAAVAVDTNLYRSAADVLTTDDLFKTLGGTHTAVAALNPASYPIGSQVYCTTDKKPVWSDGAAHFVDAAGANHT